MSTPLPLLIDQGGIVIANNGETRAQLSFKADAEVFLHHESPIARARQTRNLPSVTRGAQG